jgi:hypothetical protein
MDPEQQKQYRQCFGTDSGKKVLGHMLIQAGHFDADLAGEGEIAIHNFMNMILNNAGIYSVENVDGYVQKLFELKS